MLSQEDTYLSESQDAIFPYNMLPFRLRLKFIAYCLVLSFFGKLFATNLDSKLYLYPHFLPIHVGSSLLTYHSLIRIIIISFTFIFLKHEFLTFQIIHLLSCFLQQCSAPNMQVKFDISRVRISKTKSICKNSEIGQTIFRICESFYEKYEEF